MAHWPQFKPKPPLKSAELSLSPQEMRVPLIKPEPLLDSLVLISSPLKITLMTVSLVFLEVLSTPFSSPTTLREMKRLLPQRWNNSGLMLPTPSFTKTGSVESPEDFSSKEDFTTVPHLRTSSLRSSRVPR